MYRDSVPAVPARHFKGPIEEWHRATDHLNALRPVASIVRRVDVHRTIVDGDDVVIVYDLVTDIPGARPGSAEPRKRHERCLFDLAASNQ